MKNILVPVGSSKNALSHLQYAVDFARAAGARLYVVQIYNIYSKAGAMIKIDDILERESLLFLKELISQVDTKGVDIVAKTFKGTLIETLEVVSASLDIELIVLEPRISSTKSEVFLGKTSGKIIKQTKIPALIVPEGCKFTPIETILFALKSAIIKKGDALNPLKILKKDFSAKVNLLLVKTPYYNPGDFELNADLKELVTMVMESENGTTFQGVLEHYKENDPDMLCVVRRKRGFFNKLWEKNVILKKDFHSTNLPVLVLKELK
ncbi:universal stress protein [Bizionia paragorgiae]|uniref:Nucleotide-binding universal stress protein, UspA family n=1 Tax=Bizionia paragorgiae TaxID=283786 RepID=A0A1H4CDD1_BIZPA|nr:universal stress protein [Bizionia paragorgiae]SEA58386.1 Nucleotide-binding universal stress protein, UspA family [Bizionia paragorgiae]